MPLKPPTFVQAGTLFGVPVFTDPAAVESMAARLGRDSAGERHWLADLSLELRIVVTDDRERFAYVIRSTLKAP